ncbi:hypothetical protein [Variovorax sp. W6]|uniref:hypothetical protein n=1 Tax=Variovorax sp. W6 TaxID=3093895 RepID=UPI003D803D5A
MNVVRLKQPRLRALNLNASASGSEPGNISAGAFLQGKNNPMIKVWARLLLNVLAWFLAMPAMFVAVGALDQRKFQPLFENIVPITAAILFVWAAWIYWRFVPSAPRIWQRIGYLAAFLLGMYLLGAGALWVTFWVMLAIHGA